MPHPGGRLETNATPKVVEQLGPDLCGQGEVAGKRCRTLLHPRLHSCQDGCRPAALCQE